MKRSILFFSITFFIVACAHLVSKEIRYQSDESIDHSLLFTNPDDYKGKIVILGGIIASSKNTQEGTYIEVVQQPLDYRGRPIPSDKPLGRFIVLHEGFLDTAIYSRKEIITVAGEVIGKTVHPVGEINYSFLLIKSKELHLLKPGYKDFSVHIGIGIWHRF